MKKTSLLIAAATFVGLSTTAEAARTPSAQAGLCANCILLNTKLAGTTTPDGKTYSAQTEKFVEQLMEADGACHDVCPDTDNNS